jgi:serine/threonine protein kinase
MSDKRNREKKCIVDQCQNIVSQELGCKYLCKYHVKLFMLNGWPGALYLEEKILNDGQTINEMCIEPAALWVDNSKWTQSGIQPIPYEIAISQEMGPTKWRELNKLAIIHDFCGNNDIVNGEYIEIIAYNGVYNYSQLGDFEKKNAHKQQIVKVPIDTWNNIIKTFPKTVWGYEGNNKSRRKIFPPIFSFKYLLKMMRFFQKEVNNIYWTEISSSEWKKIQIGLSYLECQDEELIQLVKHHINRLNNDIVVINTKDGKKHYFSKTDKIISDSEWIQNLLKKHFTTNPHNDYPTDYPVIPMVFDSVQLEMVLKRLNEKETRNDVVYPLSVIHEIVFEGLKFPATQTTQTEKDLNVLHHILEYLINKRCNLKYLLGQFWIGTIDITDLTHPDPVVEYIENLRNILHKRKDMHVYITTFESVFPRFIRSVDMIPLYKDQKRYTRCKGLGSGTFGSVSSYYDNISRNFVALKKQRIVDKINPEQTTDLKHILREINILLHLSPHLNILHMENFFRDHDNIYIVTPYHKQTLTKLIYETKKFKTYLPLNKIKTIISHILHGLKWMHFKGVIHADLKPDNIMDNNKTGNMEIIDFGSAKHFMGNQPYKFKYGTDIVTATYRAPELFPNSAYYDCSLTSSVDMWSVGVILLQLLTPFYDEHDDSPFSITYERRKKYFQHINEKEPNAKDMEAWNTIYNVIVENAISDFIDKELYTISKQKILTHIKKYSHLKQIPDDLLDLLFSLLALNPQKRLSAELSLAHTSMKDVSILHPYINKSMNIKPEPLIFTDRDSSEKSRSNKTSSMEPRKSRKKYSQEGSRDQIRLSGVPPDGGPSFAPLKQNDSISVQFPMRNTSRNRDNTKKKRKKKTEIKIEFH